MRLRGSKLGADVLPSSSDLRKRRPGKRGGVFRPSCLCPSAGSRDSGSDSDDQLSDQRRKEHDRKNPSANQVNSASGKGKATSYAKVKAKQTVESVCTSSTTEFADLTSSVPRAGGSCSKSSSTQPMSRSSRFFSRFNFIPRNLSFKFNRATFGSSSASPAPPPRFPSPNEEDFQIHSGPDFNFIYRSKSSEFQEFMASYVASKASTPLHEKLVKGNSERNPTSGASDSLQGDSITHVQSNARTDSGSVEARYSNKKVAAMEPVEENICLHKTAKVGRLRDRVLLGSSTDLSASPLQRERDVKDAGRVVGMSAFGSDTGTFDSDHNPLMSASSPTLDSNGFSGSIYRSENYELETARSREARYRELLEHKSNFIEKRRRVRSQVRAHQRSRSRSDNQFEHERSCSHRTGHCSCPNGNTGSRAGVSRIVVLAEALFEVLDEIHQQSVDLPSQPSATLIGSVPAPNETLNSYGGSQKPLAKEIARCCLCLIEYEKRDSTKILPCRHEFHRTCIDKWLRENQRSCPLCRPDVCRQDSVLRRK